jgi:hypothetical protein
MPQEQDSEALFIRLYLDEDVFKSLAPGRRLLRRSRIECMRRLGTLP